MIDTDEMYEVTCTGDTLEGSTDSSADADLMQDFGESAQVQGEGTRTSAQQANGDSSSPSPSGNHEEEVMTDSWRGHRKHVFVLSEAGKPIYSRYGNEEALSTTMGVMMALVSFVQSGDDAIRSIHSGKSKIGPKSAHPLQYVIRFEA